LIHTEVGSQFCSNITTVSDTNAGNHQPLYPHLVRLSCFLEPWHLLPWQSQVVALWDILCVTGSWLYQQLNEQSFCTNGSYGRNKRL